MPAITVVRTLRTRGASFALTAVIVALALTTAYIHLTLGGLLFILNAAGFAVLAAALAAGAIPHPLIRRFSWLPRIGLTAFTGVTIGAYLMIGTYFSLGWTATSVEVAILVLLAADLFRVYGSPAALTRAAMATFNRGSGRPPMRAA